MKTTDTPPTLIVAGRSARLMAQAAQRDGYRVVALDAFGDLDTRQAAHAWRSIVAPAGARLDPQATLAGLRELRDSMTELRAAPGQSRLLGWVAGSDFETEPDLLQAGADLLPLLGTAPKAVRQVRDPGCFFDVLRELGLPHPETQLHLPADASGWLRKLGRGCGGWHIRHAASAPAVAAERAPYFQREAPGQPMSALFVAHEDGHRRVGLNALIVRPLGAHPHVYRGAVGPVGLPATADQALARAIDALVSRFALRGLCSLDFLWHDGEWSLLEINPRPSASMALYTDQPLMREHVAACGRQRLPPAAAQLSPLPSAQVRGIETVFARTAFRLSPAQADSLAARPDCHDLPAAGASFAPGDPVCSVSAVENNPVAVCERLAAKRQTLREAWARG